MKNNTTDYISTIIAALAYIAVVLIWSTTPLTIKWSGDGIGFLPGVVLRMAIGACVALSLVLLVYKALPLDAQAIKAYIAVGLAIFGGMLPVYWGAQYIPSGLISVIFGLTPMVTGYLAWRFIHEQSFNTVKILGAIAGIVGLLFIFLEDVQVSSEQYIYGVASVLLSVLLHSMSSVWIKSIKATVPPLSLVAGGLLFSMPLFGVVYMLFAPELPDDIPHRALWSIAYLGVVGSVLGFVCYYYLLQKMQATSVALITLITPVTALWIGYIFNNEVITEGTYIGTGFVLFGLALHQWGDMLSKRVWKKRKFFYG